MVFVVAEETILEIAKKVQNELRSAAINTGTAKDVAACDRVGVWHL